MYLHETSPHLCAQSKHLLAVIFNRTSHYGQHTRKPHHTTVLKMLTTIPASLPENKDQSQGSHCFQEIIFQDIFHDIRPVRSMGIVTSEDLSRKFVTLIQNKIIVYFFRNLSRSFQIIKVFSCKLATLISKNI